MRLFNFDLCATVYRCLLVALTPEQAEKSAVRPGGSFFAFGVGNLPMTGYFFPPPQDRAEVAYPYFEEKFWHVSPGREGHPHTIGVAHQVFHYLTLRAAPKSGPGPDRLGLPADWEEIVLLGEVGLLAK